MDNFVAANFYSSHVHANSKWYIWIGENMLVLLCGVTCIIFILNIPYFVYGISPSLLQREFAASVGCLTYIPLIEPLCRHVLLGMLEFITQLARPSSV